MLSQKYVKGPALVELPVTAVDSGFAKRSVNIQVQATYTTRSRRGGILTAVVGAIIFLLVLVSD
jgi:hypothetical protein